MGSPEPSRVLELARTAVSVHARRPGAQIASKTFDPVDRCPEAFTKWSDEDPSRLRPYIPTGVERSKRQVVPGLVALLLARAVTKTGGDPARARALRAEARKVYAKIDVEPPERIAGWMREPG